MKVLYDWLKEFADISLAPDQLRAQETAIKFVEGRMTPSDLVAVMTVTSEMKVVQDFTGDRAVLVAELRKIVPSPDSAAAAAGDVDRRLLTIQQAAAMLEPVPEKKLLIYFSNGVTKTGAGSQAQSKAAVDAAVRANVAIYPVDPGGTIPAWPAR